MRNSRCFLIIAIVGLMMGQSLAPAGITLTTLVSFNGANGDYPAGLIQATNGLIYGTTFLGGDMNCGSIFRINQNGSLTTLLSFGITNGCNPGPLIQARNGSLYGTTADGGVALMGTVWKMNLDGEFTNLVSFLGTNGVQPICVRETSGGRLVGVTTYGGPGHPGGSHLSGFGTVFRLDNSGNFTNLAFFSGTNGAFPISILEDSSSNLVGCTTFGGIGFSGTENSGFGTVYSIKPDANNLISLYSFDGTNGAGPNWPEGFVLNGGGTISGSLNFGGVGFDGSDWSGNGTLFELSLNETNVTHTYFNVSNGVSPAALVRANDRNLYGLSYGGGDQNFGTIFRLTTDGLETVVSFHGTNGANPASSIIQGVDNNFYGTTSTGGNFNKGTIFRLSVPLRPTLRIEPSTTESIFLAWEAVVSQRYQFQTSTNMVAWQNYGALIEATNSVMSISSELLESPRLFYRLLVQP